MIVELLTESELAGVKTYTQIGKVRALSFANTGRMVETGGAMVDQIVLTITTTGTIQDGQIVRAAGKLYSVETVSSRGMAGIKRYDLMAIL